MTVLDTFDLSGRVALVTGGAGVCGRRSGAFAKASARTYIGLPRCAKLTYFCRRTEGEATACHRIRLTRARRKFQCARFFRLSSTGTVDVLVNNAVLQPMRQFESPVSDFELSLRVNATGPFLMTRAFGLHMAERQGGSIINIGSIKGMVGPDRLVRGPELECGTRLFLPQE